MRHTTYCGYLMIQVGNLVMLVPGEHTRAVLIIDSPRDDVPAPLTTNHGYSVFKSDIPFNVMALIP